MPARERGRSVRGAVAAGLGVSALLLTACGASTPDANISGKVADSDGQPLPDAVIVVGEGQVRTATVTKHDGTYSLSNQLTGNTAVHVFAPGFVYDPGHTLKSLNSGDNTYDVKLKPQQAGAGPTFSADPTISVSGSTLNFQASISAGPGSPIGSELLAVDVTDGFAVLLNQGGSGASGSVARKKVSAYASWIFIATDDACQESTTFPSAAMPQ